MLPPPRFSPRTEEELATPRDKRRASNAATAAALEEKVMANMSGAADGLDDDEAPPPVMLQGKSLGWLHARTVKVVTTAGVAVAICHSWQSMPQPACPPRAPPVERPRGHCPIPAAAHY